MFQISQLLRTNLDQFAQLIDQKAMEHALRSPVFVMSAPRSGSTLLMELLSKHPSVWTIGRESHIIYKEFPHLKAQNAAFDSGRLTAQHADEETIHYMRLLYYMMLQNRDKEVLYQNHDKHSDQHSVFVEKTPRNAINIPFLLKVFPQARFLVLYRQPQATISSLIEAWGVGAETGRFVSFRELPGWHLPHWCFLLPPGWKSLINQPLEKIAAFQWRHTYELVLSDLDFLMADRCHFISFENVLSTKSAVMGLCQFLGISPSDDFLKNLDTLKPSESTVSAPAQDKWKRHEDLIQPLMHELTPVFERLRMCSSIPVDFSQKSAVNSH